MNVVPRHYITSEDIKTVIPEKGWVVIECEALSPPSSKGKTVYVFFEPHDVTKMLLLCRDAARRARM